MPSLNYPVRLPSLALAVLLVVGVLAGRPWPLAPLSATLATARAVTYCMAGETALKMDLYFPAPLEVGPAPVALYIHGGGWAGGDKSWIGRVVPAETLAARGYLVAAVNYRLAPANPWPAQIADVKCAV